MFSFKDLIQATRGERVQGDLRGRMQAVCIDSRRVQKGDVFIAVKGDVFDGHDFVAEAVAAGAKAVIVSKAVKVKDARIGVIKVPDTLRALGDVARFHRLRSKVTVIAITGSAGKTTVKEMVAKALSRKYCVLKNEGTKNNHIGVPLTLLQITPAHQMVVLECGTNQPGDIAWLADIARPEAAIITNIGESHLEKLIDINGVLKEKWALAERLPKKSWLFINGDDARLVRRAAQADHLRVMACSVRQQARFKANNIQKIAGHCLRFSMDRQEFTIHSCALSSVQNAVFAYACAVAFGVPVSRIAKAIQDFTFLGGRGQILPLGRGWLIDDSYNANPVSMRSALQALQALPVKGKKILVVADMLELGSQAKALHLAMGRFIAGLPIDHVLTVGPLARLMGLEAMKHKKRMMCSSFTHVEGVQQRLSGILADGDAVLVKGSRRMQMEQVVEFLLASPGN